MEVYKDGATKNYTRLLIMETIKNLVEVIKNKRVNTFSLPADALVFENQLSSYLRQNNVDHLLHCVEKEPQIYELSRQKILNSPLLSESAVIKKTSDAAFYRNLDKIRSIQKFDAAWHDWCGPIDATKVDTFTRSCIRLNQPNVIAITLMEDMRNSTSGKKLVDQFGNWFNSQRKEIIIPMMLSFRLKPHGLTLVPVKALRYRTCFTDRQPSLFMLFYIFQVISKHNKIPRKLQMKPWMNKNFYGIESHDGVLREIYVEEI